MKSSAKRDLRLLGRRLGSLGHVKKEDKRADRASLGNTIIDRNFPGCVA